ncbi:hypothetical protein [Maricaulis sp.]|uniref:hypothetical protein n=1 Tax=Maricaulis sp. TaxID=1486257 RepID=UPI003A927A91
MPRLTLVPPTPHQPHPCPVEEVREIIAELYEARDGETDGPAVLWLVNDLMTCCESRVEAHDADPAASHQAILARRNFLSRLTGFAEDIRRSNGELSDEFLAFLATTPAAIGDYTTN